jgi:hypothetical protein
VPEHESWNVGAVDGQPAGFWPPESAFPAVPDAFVDELHATAAAAATDAVTTMNEDRSSRDRFIPPRLSRPLLRSYFASFDLNRAIVSGSAR